MEKKEIREILKQIYQNVQHDYDSQPVNPKVIDESLIELRKLGKSAVPTSKQGKELYALVKKYLEQCIILSKTGKLDSIEQGLLLLKLLKEFQVQDQLLAKEEQQKKENELHSETQEAMQKKFQQIAVELREMILLRIKLDREWLEFLENQKKAKEEKEKLERALAALNKLFEELENSLAFTQVELDNGRVVDIYHRDIFRSSEYKQLHKDYTEGKINEAEFNRKEKEIVLQCAQRIAQQHYGSDIKQPDAVKVYHATRDEKQKAVHYSAFIDAVKEIGYTQEEKLDTQVVRKITDTSAIEKKNETSHEQASTQEATHKTETQEYQAEEQEHHAEDVHEEEIEKDRAEETIDTELDDMNEDYEYENTSDDLGNLYQAFENKSSKITTVSPSDALSEVEEMINTLEPFVQSRHKKIDNKNNPDVDPQNPPPSPSP